MRITHCLHVALLVSDLDKAEYFYGTVLNLSKVERSLKFPGAWYEAGGFQLHLIVADDTTQTLHNPHKWGRNAHVAFAVDDLAAAKAQLLARQHPVQMSASGRAALFTHDPDGNVIELNQA